MEAKFGDMGYRFVWHDNDDLTLVSHVPGYKIAANGRKTFYNSLVAGYLEKFDPRNPYGKAVALGDDRLVEESLILDLYQFMQESSVIYPWKSGDFMLIDNVLCYHSRQPFKGRRKVYASIANGLKPVTDTQTHLSLTSGDKMPAIGLGCWKLPKTEAAEIVYNAIKLGYRCIDQAAKYGNEAEAGAGI